MQRKKKENPFLKSLENDFDINYATDYFCNVGESKKVLCSLTSILLVKAYYYFFGFWHIGALLQHNRGFLRLILLISMLIIFLIVTKRKWNAYYARLYLKMIKIYCSTIFHFIALTKIISFLISCFSLERNLVFIKSV